LTQHELDLFMIGVISVSGVMAVINALRYKSRGVSALVLSLGFLIMAITAQLYRAGASQTLINVCAALLILCLLGDFFLRSGGQQPRKKR